jgi:hypothetical protein
VLPTDIKWQDDGGGFFPAAIFGKLDNPGSYMFLNKAQDGATLPPHWHSQDEHLIILSGTFLMGIGDTFDEHALQAVPAGGYIFTPANVHHFCKTKGETVWSERNRLPIPRFLHPRCEGLRRCLWANGEWMETLQPVAPCQMAEGEAAAVSSSPAPGGLSLIEDFVSSSPSAHLHSVIWWERLERSSER